MRTHLLSLVILASGCVVQPSSPGASSSTPRAASSGESVAAPAGADGLTPQGPFRCDGQEEMTLEGVTIDVPDNAVEVSGQCTVTIKRSRLRGGNAGLFISGQGHVTVVETEVIGGAHAIMMNDQATLSSSGSRYHGTVDKRDQASVDDQGGNVW